MAMLVHEIWETVGKNGHVLPGCCLAGPDGDGFRELLHADASNKGISAPRYVCSFEAGCHFEAMTIYYRHYGWGEYTTDIAWDREPYPDDWAQRQKSRPADHRLT